MAKSPEFKNHLLLAALGLSLYANASASAATQFNNQSELGGKLKMPIHEWYNDGQSAKAIIVAVPALIFNGRAYDGIARHLADEGYHVYSADIRGYGDWLDKDKKFGDDQAIHYGQSKEDLTKILTTLRKDFPDKKVYCLGESLGANLALWEASTDPQLLDGVITVGLTNRNRKLTPRPHWVVTITKGLDHPKHPIDLKMYMLPVLTEDRKVTEAMVNDKETTTALSPTDIIKANITNKNSIKEVEKIPPSMPVLIIAGAKDHVQNSKTLHELMQRIGSRQKELRILPGKGHVLIEHRVADPVIVQLIDRWLLERQSDSQIPLAATPHDFSSGQ
jgi:alpha-beta hydrolase superfamily lysophospholipase